MLTQKTNDLFDQYILVFKHMGIFVELGFLLKYGI